jgi:outer membrane protein assembly factor BamD
MRSPRRRPFAPFAGRPVLAVVLALAALPAVSALTGCEDEPPRTALNYTSNAKRAFDDAMAEFNSHNWIEAQNLFREFKRKYSSARKYVLLAELRIADADFEQEKFAEAIREYRQFVHDHQGQNITEETAYARSRIADAEYHQIGDSFFLASGEERDQASVLDAYRELRSFIHDYPSSKESDRMRKLLTDVTGRLIRHELYVARFYLNKSNYEATIARVQYAIRNFSSRATVGGDVSDDAGLEPEALILLGETYLKMHKWSDARDSFASILQHFPRSSRIQQAQRYLEFMKEKGV